MISSFEFMPIINVLRGYMTMRFNAITTTLILKSIDTANSANLEREIIRKSLKCMMFIPEEIIELVVMK